MQWAGSELEVWRKWSGSGENGRGRSHSTAEPDVCRALTGVAEGAVPDHGELLGAGSPWVVVREGKGRDWPGHLKGWDPDGEDPRGSEEGSKGGMRSASPPFLLRDSAPLSGL